MTDDGAESTAEVDRPISRKAKVYAFLASSAFFSLLAMASDMARPPYIGWKAELATGVLLTTTLWLVFVVDPLARLRRESAGRR